MQNIFTKIALKLGCDTEATGIEASHERKQVFIFKSNHACSLDIERCEMGLRVVFGFSCLLLAAFTSAAPENGEPQQILNEDKIFWMAQGLDDVIRAAKRPLTLNRVKNVIFFLGDGMGPSTVTAGRIYAGQKLGKLGEEHQLSFEKFDNVGLLKTYNVDKQVGDSAGTATAYLTGVKGRFGTIGMDVSNEREVCRPELGGSSHVDSFFKWAQDAGKHTGLVTTTRVTHATPAGVYAHTPDRDWECDSQVPKNHRDHPLCKDITRQLVEDEPGRNLRVILGGGRTTWSPDTDVNGTKKWPCHRGDNRDLVQEWRDDKLRRGVPATFVGDRRQLLDVDIRTSDFLLGLFAKSHLPYEADIVPGVERTTPSLAEMTEKAIRFLEKNDEGYVLLVESGKIDHGHHANLALKALEEVVALDDAVTVAQRLTDPATTLLVVTADHSHTFNINGYSVRGNPITGLTNGVDNPSENKYNFTTLSYSTGPGFWNNLASSANGTNSSLKEAPLPFKDPTTLDIHNKDYRQLSHTPAEDSSHGGEDVAVYAHGPMAHLFHGVHDQSFVAHAIGYAACLGPYSGSLCHDPPSSSTAPLVASHSLLTTLLLVLCCHWFICSRQSL